MAPHAEQLVPRQYALELGAEHAVGRHLHSATYVFVLIGLFLLWRSAHRNHVYWSTKLLIGTMLVGFGAFNTIEGIMDDHILGIHHVNETVPRSQWLAWDIGFTLWGVAMLVIGIIITGRGDRGTPGR